MKNKFGILRQKVLDALTEHYLNENKVELKKIIKEIKSDKQFSELHLFYEEIENKKFDNREVAELFVEEVTKLLKNKNKINFKKIEKLVEGSRNVGINNCHIYLDILMEEQTFFNIDKIVYAKKGLVDFLLEDKKPNTESQDIPKIENTSLLNVVLVNDFNSKYNDLMNEEDKKIFKDIMSLTSSELMENGYNLKFEVRNKVRHLLSECDDDILKEKLETTLNEVNDLEIDRFNYYRLMLLKDGLV